MTTRTLTGLFAEIRHLKERIQKAPSSRARAQYDIACDLARKMIDQVEDDTIAMGLLLHGVNGLTWSATEACLGVEDIQDRCYDYLMEEDSIFLW